VYNGDDILMDDEPHEYKGRKNGIGISKMVGYGGIETYMYGYTPSLY
jgi:hypothetical protein